MEKKQINTDKKQDVLEDMKLLADQIKKNIASQQSLNLDVELGDEDLDTNYEQEPPNLIANPDLSHRLYYTMRSSIMSNLPKTDNRKPMTIERKTANNSIKKFNAKIYAEKALFLNRGKDIDKNGRRGSNQIQAYIPEYLKTAYDVVNKWVAQGADPWDLFLAFYELNIERGYRKEGNQKKKLTDDLIEKATFGNLVHAITKAGKPK